MRIGKFCSLTDLLLSGEWVCVSNVFADRGGKQHRVLQHRGKLLSQVGQFVVLQHNTIQPDLALGRIVETHKEVHYCAFAGPGAAGDARTRSRSYRKRDTMEHLLALRIS